MMENIVKMPSGFYAIAPADRCEEYKHTGKLIDWTNAALTRWDGSTGTAYPHDISGSAFEYYQTANGTVYYTDAGGKNARIWCAGSQLSAHCHRLYQIAHRYDGKKVTA